MNLILRTALFLLLFSLPFQIGKHFWIAESLVLGRRIDYLSPTLYFSDILLLFFLITFFLKNSISAKTKKTLFIISLLAFGFTSVYGVSWLSIYFAAKLIEFAAFGLVLVNLKPTKREIVIPLSVSILAIYPLLLMQFLTQSSIGGIWYWLGERNFSSDTPGIAQLVASMGVYLRPYATLPHPNVLGGFLVVLLPYFLVSPVSKKRWEYLLHFTSIYLMIMGIFLSFSRAAWITTLFLMLLIFFKKFWKTPLKIGLLLTSLVIGIILEELLLGRFSQLWLGDTGSTTERLELLTAATKFFSQSPLVGVSWGRFIPNLATLRPLPQVFQPVHSIYGLMAAETGLVGLGLFSIIFAKALKKTWVKNHDVFLSLVAIGLLGSVDHYFLTLQQTQLLLILIFSLAFV